MSNHHPPHIYIDDAWYAISSATLKHTPFLARERTKALVRDTLKDFIQRFGIVLWAWVILDDHYHVLLKTSRGKDLPRFFGQLHGSTARQLNLWDATPGRRIWHNYWDTCMRNEADLWSHFNYIHNNPVKHGYVQRLEEWPFSSYHYYLRPKGRNGCRTAGCAIQ